MIEILNAVHNIVSVSPEDLPEHPRERQTIYYSDKKDMVVIAGWGDDTGRIAEMIVNYLELSGRKAEGGGIFPVIRGRFRHQNKQYA